MASASTNLEIVRQVAAAQNSPPAKDEPQEEAPKPRVKRGGDDLPVEFYNSRYMFERIYDPVDAQKRKGQAVGDVPRSVDFSYGYFLATQKWEVDLLRKTPHVHEADLDEPVRCGECRYVTKSLKDYQNHIATHF